MAACQTILKSVSFRCSGGPLPRPPCSQCSLGHARVSDRSIIGLLPRAPPSQVSVRQVRVSGWCRIGPFPVILPYPDTITPATGTSVASSNGRPFRNRSFLVLRPVLSNGHPCPRGPLWLPRVPDWAQDVFPERAIRLIRPLHKIG